MASCKTYSLMRGFSEQDVPRSTLQSGNSSNLCYSPMNWNNPTGLLNSTSKSTSLSVPASSRATEPNKDSEATLNCSSNSLCCFSSMRMTSFFFIAVIYMIRIVKKGAFVKHLNHACLFRIDGFLNVLL
jgi:hypothetical protein